MAATVESLREHLLRVHGTDYGASDEVLAAQLDRARAYVERTGYRLSPTVLAADEIRKGYLGPDAPRR